MTIFATNLFDTHHSMRRPRDTTRGVFAGTLFDGMGTDGEPVAPVVVNGKTLDQRQFTSGGQVIDQSGSSPQQTKGLVADRARLEAQARQSNQVSLPIVSEPSATPAGEPAEFPWLPVTLSVVGAVTVVGIVIAVVAKKKPEKNRRRSR